MIKMQDFKMESCISFCGVLAVFSSEFTFVLPGESDLKK